MNLAEQLQVLQATQGDPAKLALATTDLKYPELSEPERTTLKTALETAAIPHWCDAAILAALLEISQKESAFLLTQLRGLAVVEPFPARGITAVNVHEASRLALRQSLATNQAGRFLTLSNRAQNYFKSDPSAAGRIEWLFHRLWLNPEQAGPEISQMLFDLRHKVEDGLALAAALHECMSGNVAPPLVQCWACWTASTVEAPYLKIGERLDLASRALQCAKKANSDYATATAAVLIADVLVERGQAGDAQKAWVHYQHSLQIYERLLKANPKSAQGVRDVSVSLRHLGDFLARRGQVGDVQKAWVHYQRCLQIHERLLKANPKSAQAARDVSLSLSRLGDFLARQGQAGDTQKALVHYQRCLQILEQLLKDNPKSVQAARDVSLCGGRLGDLLVRRGQAGDAQKALVHFQRCLQIHERLLKDNPKSAQAVRDMSIILGRLGDFLARRGQAGDAQKALVHFQRCLQIHERLLKDNPESAQAARDVSVSVGWLGEFLARWGQAGDAQKALVHFQRSLQIHERLLKDNPKSAQAARDVSVSVQRLGDFLARRGQAGDAQKALVHFQRCLQIDEKLLKANPKSAQSARDLSLSLGRLGDFLARRGQIGDAQKALAHYQRCLQIHKRLLKANPDSAEAARDVSVSGGRLGDFLARRGQAGDAQKALVHYQRCLQIDEKLLKANPKSAQAARDVSVSVQRLGDFLARRGQVGDAQQAWLHFQRCLQIYERLLKANPDSTQAARDVSLSLGRLGDFLVRRGQASDAQKALVHYQRCLEIDERLLKANLDSAEAARDLSLSLGQLGDFLARRRQAGDAQKALAHYQRCLQIHKRLLKANPDSAEAARDVVVSHLNFSRLYHERGNKRKATQSLAACFATLDSYVRQGLLTDSQMRALHDQLTLLFRLAEESKGVSS